MRTPEEMAALRERLYGDQRVPVLICRHCGTPRFDDGSACTGTLNGARCGGYQNVRVQPTMHHDVLPSNPSNWREIEGDSNE